MLETYLNATAAMEATLATLEHSIDSTEKFVNARLATQRNALLRLDVSFTVVTAATSLSGLVAGIFGMNLSSNLEDVVGGTSAGDRGVGRRTLGSRVA